MKQTELSNTLLRLQERIDEARNTHASLKGALHQIKEQLQEDFKVKTSKEARRLLTKLQKELQVLEKQIEQGIKELEKRNDF